MTKLHNCDLRYCSERLWCTILLWVNIIYDIALNGCRVQYFCEAVLRMILLYRKCRTQVYLLFFFSLVFWKFYRTFLYLVFHIIFIVYRVLSIYYIVCRWVLYTKFNRAVSYVTFTASTILYYIYLRQYCT